MRKNRKNARNLRNLRKSSIVQFISSILSLSNSTRSSVSRMALPCLRLAARPRRPRGLLETLEIGEGRARLGDRTHFSVPGRLSRKGGPGSIHSQTQPLSLVWPFLAISSGPLSALSHLGASQTGFLEAFQRLT